MVETLFHPWYTGCNRVDRPAMSERLGVGALSATSKIKKFLSEIFLREKRRF